MIRAGCCTKLASGWPNVTDALRPRHRWKNACANGALTARRGPPGDVDHGRAGSRRACTIMNGMDARFLGIPELTGTPRIAVVVDVMRAFTVAAWIFARGAQRIVLADSLDQARTLKAAHPDWAALKDGAP